MKILTANRLIDGEAVWRGADGVWVESIDRAHVADDSDGQEQLEAEGRKASANNEVVDVMLIDVDRVDDRIVPLRLREKIRAAGPTNRTDLGKQARPPAG